MVSGHFRVKYKYQSSPLFVSMVCSKTQDEKFLQSTKIKRVVCSEEERRLALGGWIFRCRGRGIRQTTRWSAQGHSPAGRRAGGAPGMKGAALRKAPAHRSHCDGLTKGIYVAFKYISKGVVNNRKRGDFTFMYSIAETRSQIAKYWVETLKGYEKVGEWIGKSGENYLRV